MMGIDPDSMLPVLAEYVRYLADRMRLKDWSFEVEVDHDLEGSLATVRIVHRRRIACLRFSEAFFGSDEQERRHAVIHELAHAPLQSMRDRVKTLVGQMTQPAFEMFREGCDHEIETLADEWAATIAPYMLTMQEWLTGQALVKSLEPHGSGDQQKRPRHRDVRPPQRPAPVPSTKRAMSLRGEGRAGPRAGNR
jgi:hypothetical protein